MERASEGEHVEDEEASTSEAGESEGTHASVGADGEEIPVSQASILAQSSVSLPNLKKSQKNLLPFSS